MADGNDVSPDYASSGQVMNEAEQTTSLSLLLIISVVVLLGLGSTWWAFDYLRNTEEPSLPTSSARRSHAIETSIPSPIEAIAGESLDSYLSKARFAVEADMLFEPAGQNALYFLGLILSDSPGHPEASEELEQVAASLLPSIRASLTLNELEQPYKIVQLVGALRPNHTLVLEVQLALQQQSDALLASALESADNGDRDAALTAMAKVRALPGTDVEWFLGRRADLEARLERSALAIAEQQRALELQQAAANAVPDWLASAQTALAADRLVEPVENNALYFLSQVDANDPDAVKFRLHLQDTLLSAANVSIGQGQFDEADHWLVAATDLGASIEQVEPLRTVSDRAYADSAGTKIIAISELVWRERVAPVYPRNAQRRGVQGHVDIAFTVTTSGETTDVTVMAAEPTGTFERAAIHAVQQWQFEPHLVRGFMVNQRSATRLRFVLD